MTRRPRRGERGFTLVELLISMTLTTLMIGMTFTIFIQSSQGMRAQSDISDLQQALVAAETVLSKELRQAGLAVPNGFHMADGFVHQAILVENHSDGPDELHLFAADPSVQAAVTSVDLDLDQVTVDSASLLAVGQVVVLVDPRTPVDDTDPVAYAACVVRIADISGVTVTLDTSAPWGATGTPDNAHCNEVDSEANTPGETMLFGFRMRAYRVDRSRPELGVLQRSITAGVEDDWEDLAIGFTDLQVATRWYEDTDTNGDLDGDGDPNKDWYSGDGQDLKTAAGAESADFPIELTLSLVVRTSRDQAGVVSARTPLLTDPTNVEHNELGDRDQVQLEGVADGDRPPELTGDRIYRWSTMRIDLRNLGVGR